MNQDLFSYQVTEIDCSKEVASTDEFTVGADTPFVGAIVAGVVAGVVGAVVGEVIKDAI
ncbi:MAG TPA: hypothetical protein VF414_02680 [Thermoanaerobaculia bacterium]